MSRTTHRPPVAVHSSDTLWTPADSSRLHKIVNKVQLLAYKLFFGHLGKFIVIAVYYLLLQTMRGQRTTIFSWHVTLPNVKYTWDHLLSATAANGGLIHLMAQSAWTPMRHIVFRGLLEGVLGIVLFQQIGFNITKYRQKLKPEGVALSPLERIVKRSHLLASPYQNGPVTGLQYAFFPVLLVGITILLGVPLYLGLHYGLAHAAHWTWLEPRIATHQSIWQKLYVGDYDGLVIGIVVGAVAARTYRAYLYDNTMYFARSWVARGRKPHWWMPQPTRDLVAWLRDEPNAVGTAQTALARRSQASKFAAWFLPLLGLMLAAFGFYVITYIAK